MRSVLVAGGSRGIGLAAARAFAEAGDKVAVTYRGDPPRDLDGVLAVRADVTDQAAIHAAFEEIEAANGPVEVLVASAGITRDTLLLRMSEDDFTSVLDTNLTGAWRMAKRATRSMLKAHFGRMIFVSSAVGLRGEAGQANYAASKAGLVGLARSLARELGSRGITANVVAPGLTATDMTAALSPEHVAAMIPQIPLSRMADPHEIAAAIAFLASDAAGYITGAVLPVDGGAGMGH